MATKLKVANYSTLDTTLEDAVKSIGEGSLRVGGEAQVPLLVWKHPTFQRWYKSQTSAGNRLDSARVLWTFRVGQQLDKVFFWCLHVNVWIASEQRSKTNEFVLSRTDLSYCVAYRGDQVVLVREFRSPVRNEAGFVYELAGGSSHNPNEDPLRVISHEVEEETGLSVDSDRFIQHETRQLVATLGAHVANLFSVELTQEELDQLKSDAGTVHGVFEDTEQTYVEIWSLKDILARQLVDWTTLGMILSVVGLASETDPYSV
jgi:8-oxo-dGTP pyrophosphatase MutT (NUDIX family)